MTITQLKERLAQCDVRLQEAKKLAEHYRNNWCTARSFHPSRFALPWERNTEGKPIKVNDKS